MINSTLPTLVELAIKSNVIFLTFVLLKKLFSKKIHPTVVYSLWLIVFIAMTLPISFKSDLSVQNMIPEKFANYTSQIAETDIKTNIFAKDAAIDVSTSPISAPDFVGTSEETFNFKEIAKSGYLLIVLSLLLFYSIQIHRIRKIKTLPVCSSLKEIIENVKNEMHYKKNIEIVLTDNLTSPAVTGVFKKKLLLPVHLVQKLTSDEIRYVVMHELTHLKYYDNLVNYVLILYRTIYFFNPLIYLICKLVKNDMELACDHRVSERLNAKEKIIYGYTLVNIMSYINHINRQFLITPLFEDKKTLKRRIIMLTNKKTSTLITLFIIVTMVLIGCSTLSEPNGKDSVESEYVLTRTVAEEILANQDQYKSIEDLSYLNNPYLVTKYVYDGKLNEVHATEAIYTIDSDEESSALKVVFNKDGIVKIIIDEFTGAASMDLYDTQYAVQTKSPHQKNIFDAGIDLNQYKQQNIYDVMNSLDILDDYQLIKEYSTERYVYYVEFNEGALSILVDTDDIVSEIGYYEHSRFSINLHNLFVPQFYEMLTLDFDYDRFTTELVPEIESYFNYDYLSTQNNMVIDMGHYWMVYHESDFDVSILKNGFKMFRINDWSYANGESKEVPASEDSCLNDVEAFIKTTPLASSDYELIDSKFEYIFDQQAVEYYVFQYGFKNHPEYEGFYIKYSTLYESVVEILYY